MSTPFRFRLVPFLFAATALVSGCTRVPTGSVGIVRNIDGEVQMTPVMQGLHTSLLDSIQPVDVTETRIPLDGLRPTDANGVSVDQLDIVVSYRLVQAKVPAFYIQTKELDSYRDDSGVAFSTVGLHVLENILKHSVQEATKNEHIDQLNGDLNRYEKLILEQAQKELDAGYPGVFQLVRINVNHFVPPQAVRDQVNAIAKLRGEAARLDEAQTLIEKQTKLQAAEAVLEGNALRQAADATHLSPEQLIAWKNARAYEAQARAIGETAVRTVNVAAQPAAGKQ